MPIFYKLLRNQVGWTTTSNAPPPPPSISLCTYVQWRLYMHTYIHTHMLLRVCICAHCVGPCEDVCHRAGCQGAGADPSDSWEGSEVWRQVQCALCNPPKGMPHITCSGLDLGEGNERRTEDCRPVGTGGIRSMLLPFSDFQMDDTGTSGRILYREGDESDWQSSQTDPITSSILRYSASSRFVTHLKIRNRLDTCYTTRTYSPGSAPLPSSTDTFFPLARLPCLFPVT